MDSDCYVYGHSGFSDRYISPGYDTYSCHLLGLQPIRSKNYLSLLLTPCQVLYLSTSCKMKVFLTGASGYIGSHVTAVLLEAGHQLTAIARSDASVSFRRLFPVPLPLMSPYSN